MLGVCQLAALLLHRLLQRAAVLHCSSKGTDFSMHWLCHGHCSIGCSSKALLLVI